MEYNQYWNEIKGIDDDVKKQDDNSQNESVISFTYNEVPEKAEKTQHGGLISPDTYEYLDETKDDELLHDAILDEEENIFDEDDEDELAESEEEDDSKMYSNSSLFDLIDEMEDKEESKEEDSRFINFDYKDDESFEDEKDVHIFADEDDEDIEPVVEEPVVEEAVVEQPAAEPEVEEEVEQPAAVEEPVVEEPVVEEVPHYESPVFEDKEETDIDQLILEAKKKEEESAQKKLIDEAGLLPLLKDIISFMPGNCGFVNYIAKLSNDDRKDLVRFIDQAMNAWLKDKTDKMFTIAEGDLSICILSDVTDPMREVQRLETVGSQMYSYEKESWSFVKLYFNEDGKLLRAETQTVTKDNFNSWQWKVVQQAGFNLWKARQ